MARGTGQRQLFSDAVAALAPTDGFHETRLDGVVAIRDSKPYRRRPVLYDSGIVLLAQGRKRGYLGGLTYDYSPQTYFVLACPLPLEIEQLDASPERPGLGLFVKVDIPMLGRLARELDRLGLTVPPPVDRRPPALFSTPLDDRTLEAAVRLAEALQNPVEADVLGNDIRRELIYHVLLGPQACALRALLWRDNSSAARIGRILHELHAAPERSISVETMARTAGMSVSAFHAAFKAATSMSPIRYQKAVRLHRAQELIAFDGRRVGDAAREVGYASASQFSRDYKRQFGLSPKDDARQGASGTPA